MCNLLSTVTPQAFSTQRRSLFDGAPLADGVVTATPMQQNDSRLALETWNATLARVRAAVPLIGGPEGDAVPKDWMWILRELLPRKKPEVDTISTLDLLRADLMARFHGQQMWIPSEDGYSIDAMLIPAQGGLNTKRPTVIFCNPNGGLYELSHLQMDWIYFYTKLECNLLLYNYRGFGRNTGKPSPEAHNIDGLAIVRYLKTELGMSKIGVHGESIGGLVASFLGQSSSDVEVVIADRTMATVPALAQRLIGMWAGHAVEWFTRWQTDNVTNFTAARCAKIICSDPDDQMIHDGASLKTGIALRQECGLMRFDIPSPLPVDASKQHEEASVFDLLSSVVNVVTANKCDHHAAPMDPHPHLGHSLSDASIRKFGESVISIARRAMEVAENPSSPTDTTCSSSCCDHDNSQRDAHVDISETEPSMESSEHDKILQSASSPFPAEMLAVVWMQLACLDGYCGQCLLQAVETGDYDRIRAWTASMLTWGATVPPERRMDSTLPPLERHGFVLQSISILKVSRTLQDIKQRYPAIALDEDISHILLMIEYIYETLKQRWNSRDQAAVASKAQSPKKEANGMPNETPYVGRLLPLHCGHNNHYTDQEKQQLASFLRDVKFLPATEEPGN